MRDTMVVRRRPGHLRAKAPDPELFVDTQVPTKRLVVALGAPTHGRGGTAPVVNDAVGGLHATLVLTGYVVVHAAAAVVVLQRRDVA